MGREEAQAVRAVRTSGVSAGYAEAWRGKAVAIPCANDVTTLTSEMSPLQFL